MSEKSFNATNAALPQIDIDTSETVNNTGYEILAEQAALQEVGEASPCPEQLIKPSDIESSKVYRSNIQINTLCNSTAFLNCVKTARDNNPHGAFIGMNHTSEEYAEMTMMTINAGAAGVAVKSDGDIVSIFKNSIIARRDNIGQVIRLLLSEALHVGGKKLNCFDGYLSKIYIEAGFAPVCRLEFNDDSAPEGWNFDRDGRPDVVFMAHNNESPPPTTDMLQDLPYIRDYVEADKLVQTYLESKGQG